MSVLKNAGELEKNYVRSMQEYGTYVQQNYLEIPEEIKKTIKQKPVKRVAIWFWKQSLSLIRQSRN